MKRVTLKVTSAMAAEIDKYARRKRGYAGMSREDFIEFLMLGFVQYMLCGFDPVIRKKDRQWRKAADRASTLNCERDEALKNAA